MGHHFTLARVAMWRQSRLHFRWECEAVQPLWKTVLHFLTKVQHRVTKRPSDFTPRYISKRTENITSTRNMYTNVCSTFICNSQKAERAQMSINWVDKQATCPLCINHNMEWTPRCNMNGPWKHCEVNKTRHKTYCVVLLIKDVQKQQIRRDRK